MGEMVDRVAKAIDTAGRKWVAENGGSIVVGFSDIPEEIFARAAIEEMQRPTAAMLEAGAACDDDDYAAQAHIHWDAMAKEAMK